MLILMINDLETVVYCMQFDTWSALVDFFCFIAISKQVWKKQCLLIHYYSSGEPLTRSIGMNDSSLSYHAY